MHPVFALWMIGNALAVLSTLMAMRHVRSSGIQRFSYLLWTLMLPTLFNLGLDWPPAPMPQGDVRSTDISKQRPKDCFWGLRQIH
ncbi:uncharacterized protein EV420DRAFT_40961 [Desarmillaria tabescens]|uniref:Uncharacterized protein n=1 Tax=Armillaria tabescens TaxID=1929756 RepID=A0AA39T7C6_ARMTA|nr:uncharacterized protein EV420DRAFT_40961 [Desarmillaria tabescens]KAK0469541.1 hypothetical protein EV420DRAFT_40961 [Desarmillaria tabescens]